MRSDVAFLVAVAVIIFLLILLTWVAMMTNHVHIIVKSGNSTMPCTCYRDNICVCSLGNRTVTVKATCR